MTLRPTALAIAATLLTGLTLGVSAQAHTVAGATAGDVALATSVQERLLSVPAYQAPGTDLVVQARNGQVHLSGFVHYANDDLPARQMAVAVDGVTGVSSNLRSWASETDIHRTFTPAPTHRAAL